MEKVGVLFSGGIESSSLLVHYLKKGYITLPIYVKTGLPWESVEIKYSLKLWRRLKDKYKNLLPIRFISDYKLNGNSYKTPEEEKDIEIPLRNFSLISSAIKTAFVKGVYRFAIGSLGSYSFPDNRREFFDRLEEVLSFGSGINFTIETPFMGLKKEEIIRKFYKAVPFGLTFSCASPVNSIHCGRCIKCMERKEGFEKAKVDDPTKYYYSV